MPEPPHMDSHEDWNSHEDFSVWNVAGALVSSTRLDRDSFSSLLDSSWVGMYRSGEQDMWWGSIFESLIAEGCAARIAVEREAWIAEEREARIAEDRKARIAEEREARMAQKHEFWKLLVDWKESKARMPTKFEVWKELEARIPKKSLKALCNEVWSNVQGPRRGSRAEFTSGYKGVYTRKGIRGYRVKVLPAKWNQATFLGSFNSPQEAALARDAAVFYSEQDVEYNYPELKRTFPPLPSHLRLSSVEHYGEITTFVMKQILASIRKFKKSGMMDPCSHLSPALIMNRDTENDDSMADLEPARCTIEPRLKEENKLAEDSDPCSHLSPALITNREIENDDSMADFEPARCTIEPRLKEENKLAEDSDHEQTSEESDGHESSVWLTDTDSEGESEAGITEDSPYTRTSSDAAGRKKRKSCVDEDDLISKLTPFVKKQIEDALNTTLLPLVSVLRTREENEQKHREKLLALENEKLALKREKLQFKRRRIAQSQPAPKTTRLGHKSQLGSPTRSPAL